MATSDPIDSTVMVKPRLNLTQARRWVATLYGLQTSQFKLLNGYDDQNFLFVADAIVDNAHLKRGLWPHGYVLKVTNSQDSLDDAFFEAQSQLMFHLVDHGLEVPIPIANRAGRFKSLEVLDSPPTDPKESPSVGPLRFMVRVLRFIPGRILNDVSPWTLDHFTQCGRFIARLDQILGSFHHPAYETRQLIWFLSHVPQLTDSLGAVADPRRQGLMLEIIDAFKHEVIPIMDHLPRGIIHGDFNEHNILLRPNSDHVQYEVFSVIDFGDSQLNPLVFELAVNIMYMMLKCTVVHPNQAGAYVIAGYETVRCIPPQEWDILRTCVAARFAQSLVLGAQAYTQDPTNEYVLASAVTGWKVIEDFWRQPKEELYEQWTAIARPPKPQPSEG